MHGAFVDGSSWNGVIADLQRRGYPAVAVANPLRSVPGDAAYLRALVDSLSGPVVLAAHSYGGAVITEAADGAANVRALVYVASFSPEVGESVADVNAKFPGSQLADNIQAVPIPARDGSADMDQYVKQETFPDFFAPDVPREAAVVMAATQRPAAANTLTDSVTRAAWKSIPSWTLVTTQDLAIPPDLQRFMAQRAGSTTVEVDASHAVTVSQPGAVADLIDRAARATAQ
ncbi:MULTISPECIES: alpha/beta hydrolase [unclassified Micromonospora]|uniref:alpha/beta fold hydrolase n=1 Tax=unclassified Micromonospora TaxID=2617518 RepID=UPI00259D0247|nr:MULTISPECIES: alpha/beta hydrolase [unclassified Micromonospora]MDM4781008.1 alpha/beta hydrolase [Micromonospora sp. b486]